MKPLEHHFSLLFLLVLCQVKQCPMEASLLIPQTPEGLADEPRVGNLPF